MTRPIGNADELQRRRVQAVKALEAGNTPRGGRRRPRRPRQLRPPLAFARGAHLVFLDESGFQLNPSVRRSLAPRGETPVLEAWDRRDRISAISRVTLGPVMASPGLDFKLLPVNKTVKAPEVVESLDDLRRQLRGPFAAAWDGHGIHSKARLVKAWLTEHPEVVAETLPPYCPEMNPDEWVWSWAKYGRLANLAAWDAQDLRRHVLDALIDLKCSPELLKSFFQDARSTGRSPTTRASSAARPTSPTTACRSASTRWRSPGRF